MYARLLRDALSTFSAAKLHLSYQQRDNQHHIEVALEVRFENPGNAGESENCRSGIGNLFTNANNSRVIKKKFLKSNYSCAYAIVRRYRYSSDSDSPQFPHLR